MGGPPGPSFFDISIELLFQKRVGAVIAGVMGASVMTKCLQC